MLAIYGVNCPFEGGRDVVEIFATVWTKFLFLNYFIGHRLRPVTWNACLLTLEMTVEFR